MFWEVDLRPHGERKYFSSKDAAPGGSANPANRLHREGLEGFKFAATSPRRNRKLTKDVQKLLRDCPEARARDLFFAAPGFKHERQRLLEPASGIEVWAIDI